jgi:hypothetical protein
VHLSSSDSAQSWQLDRNTLYQPRFDGSLNPRSTHCSKQVLLGILSQRSGLKMSRDGAPGPLQPPFVLVFPPHTGGSSFPPRSTHRYSWYSGLFSQSVQVFRESVPEVSGSDVIGRECGLEILSACGPIAFVLETRGTDSNVGVNWSHAGFLAGVFGRYIGGFKECAGTTTGLSFGSDCYHVPDLYHSVPAYMTWDANVGYAIGSGIGKTTLGIGGRERVRQGTAGPLLEHHPVVGLELRLPGPAVLVPTRPRVLSRSPAAPRPRERAAAHPRSGGHRGGTSAATDGLTP